MRPTRLPLPVAALAVVALPACGGEPLTPEQYVSQGNAICRESRAQIDAVPEPRSTGNREDTAAYVRRVQEVATTTILAR